MTHQVGREYHRELSAMKERISTAHRSPRFDRYASSIRRADARLTRRCRSSTQGCPFPCSMETCNVCSLLIPIYARYSDDVIQSLLLLVRIYIVRLSASRHNPWVNSISTSNDFFCWDYARIVLNNGLNRQVVLSLRRESSTSTSCWMP